MQRLTEADARTALRDHVIDKAREARLRHGPEIDAAAMTRLLDDGSVVRYPVELRFDAGPLEPGEFAWPMPLGDHPSDGYRLCVHPWFEHLPDAWPLLVAYHIPTINYGDIAGHEDAECFGAALFGLTVDDYYDALCALVDAMPATSALPA